MEQLIDLRSDTVTQPTPSMREAMARADVGDDVFGEDPTVNRLEERAAELMGKESAVMLTSGTMGNLVGVLSHCHHGEEVLVGTEAHIFWYEAAGTAAIGGLQLRTIPDDDGAPSPADVASAIRSDDIRFPRTAAVCIENTHNRRGGVVVTPERARAIAGVATSAGAKVHLDGARIFNAATALGLPARVLAAPADSVTFCLSKGLSAPVGSLLCGSQDYVRKARRLRKMLGGGMRQAGVIAAAGLVALDEMVGRLAEDHENARRLAEGLARIEGIHVDVDRVQTNVVVVQLTVAKSDAMLARLLDHGIRATRLGQDRVRLVTHYGIERRDIDTAIARFELAARHLADSD